MDLWILSCLLRQLDDLVKVDVYNDGRELTDPCQCHPEVIVTKAFIEPTAIYHLDCKAFIQTQPWGPHVKIHDTSSTNYSLPNIYKEQSLT
eukprot:348033-Amphidinium_carterae.1